MKISAVFPIIFAVFCSLVSCKNSASEEPFGKPEITPEDLGKELFLGKGNCFACHKTNATLVGPSLQEIAKIYKEKNGDMIPFLKGEGEPIIDPSKFELMKPNFAITRTFSEQELKALEAYVYFHLK